MAVSFRRTDNLKGGVAERLIGLAARRGFQEGSQPIIRGLQQTSPVDRGSYRRGHKTRIAGAGLRTRLTIFNAAKDAPYVEFGRKAGSKQPPSDAILPWVRRKGLGARAFSIKTRRQIGAGTRRTFNRSSGKRRTSAQSLALLQRGIAFLIARAIGKRGIKGKEQYKNMRSNYASEISAMMTKIQIRTISLLNA